MSDSDTYKGSELIGLRVEIPASTDEWMSGDRYGQIVRAVENSAGVVIAHLDMDRTGKRLRFRADRLRYMGSVSA